MGFGNVFLAGLSRSAAGAGFLLGISRLAGLPFEYFGSSSRSLPARSGSPRDSGPLAEHAGMERVAERTLSLPDRALHLILSDPAKDDFLTFIGELLRRHRAEIELFFFRRKPALDLREPIAVAGQRRGDKEHEPTDLHRAGEIRK